MIKRKGMIIYIQTPKILSEIEKCGINITYKNEPRGYVVGYVDEQEYSRIKKQVEAFKQVRKVEESLLDMSQFSFKE